MISRLFITLFLSIFAFSLSAQTDGSGKSSRIILIDGYFFNDFPGPRPEDYSSMHLILDDGSYFTCYGYPESSKLSDNDIAKAIPVEKVENGAEILKKYRHFVAAFPGGKFPRDVKQMIPTIKTGEQFPDFTAEDIDGKIWTNGDTWGKVMVVNVWYTGCGPCRKEMPELSEWKNELPDVMFFSSTYESPEEARPVIEKRGFNWIPLVNNTQFRDFMGTQGYYPTTIVVDREGTVRAVEIGTSAEKRRSLLNTVRELAK